LSANGATHTSLGRTQGACINKGKALKVRLNSSSQSRRQISESSNRWSPKLAALGGTYPPLPDRAKEGQLLGTNERWLSHNYATGAQECVSGSRLSKSPEAKISVYAPPLSLLLFPAQGNARLEF